MTGFVCGIDDGVGAAGGAVAADGAGGATGSVMGDAACSGAGVGAVVPAGVGGPGIWSLAPAEGKSPADADIDTVNATRTHVAKCGARLRASKVRTRHVIMNLAF